MGLLAQEIENKTKHLDLLELSFCSKLLRNVCLCRSETFLGFYLQNFNFQDFICICVSFGGYPVKCFTKKTSVLLCFLCTQLWEDILGKHLSCVRFFCLNPKMFVTLSQCYFSLRYLSLLFDTAT